MRTEQRDKAQTQEKKKKKGRKRGNIIGNKEVNTLGAVNKMVLRAKGCQEPLCRTSAAITLFLTCRLLWRLNLNKSNISTRVSARRL
jgi:hypothetical protein